MSRDIIFRAWDKQAKCWAKNLAPNFMEDAVAHIYMSDRYEFVEHIGLRDKNGNQIFT